VKDWLRETVEWPDGTVAAHYGFIHALYQEVLYDRVPTGRRIRLHKQIGEREEAGYGERAGEIATELAVHFERGRDAQRAVQYLRLAGENAEQRSAYQEAIAYLTKGLELLKTLPDTPEHTQQELALQTTLGSALIATTGWGAPEMEKAYARARELCQEMGETPQIFPVLIGLWIFYLARAEYKTAHELVEQLFSLVQRQQDISFLLEAHMALGCTLFYLGEFASARAHVEQGIVIYNPQQHNSRAFLYGGADPVVACLSYAAWALWFLGYPDQSLKRMDEALALAQELSHPFSLALVLNFAARLHQFRRERHATQGWAKAAIILSTEQGFASYLAMGTILQGWALAEQRRGGEGIAQTRQGLATWRATGTEAERPYWLTLLAEAYGKTGRTEEGLVVLVEALDTVNKTGERWHEAELYRLKGELLLAQEGKKEKAKGKNKERAEAEACFHQALNIARRQEAKSLELRAVMSLSRLWQKQGKKEEARQMLAEIYHWFTEGFDTADLKDAKALLETLS